jgi:hypothetical protein
LSVVASEYTTKLGIYEVIIIGDSVEFTEAAITYQDGTIMSGSGIFDPNGALTRAEAAKIVDLFTEIEGL